MKPEREEESESSDEDLETLSEIGRADQLVGYIIYFTNTVKLYQRKKWNCFGCGSLDHLLRDCLKDLSKNTQWVRGDSKEERQSSSETSSCSASIPRWGSQGLKASQKVPFLNNDPPNWWNRPENIAWVWNGAESSLALLDNGSTINVVIPDFIEVHFLDVGPLSNLSNKTLGINGFRGVFYWLLGYVMIRVQVEGGWGYDKDQVTLVIPDSTGFGSWVPITLSIPTIN